MQITEKQKTEFTKKVFDTLGSTYAKKDALALADKEGLDYPRFLFKKELRCGYGRYASPLFNPSEFKDITPEKVEEREVALAVKVDDFNVESNGFTENLVPAVDPLFVPFGNFSTITKVLKSKLFYPIFVTGMSGNGKTFGIEQACAKTKREVIRVNLTAETDEDDLIGGFRLVNGETKFFKGPVIKAMEKGAVLLLDEIDLANPAKVMCLQSILEGKGYFIKKTGEFVTPKKGFTAIATANTKGKGSEDGRFIGTNILNEAFLERFPVTVEQEYPSVSIETKILERVFDSLDIKDTKFAKRLVEWADIIRKTFYDGGVDEIISTRRLVHIAKAFSIFGDRMKAINLCINRFDEDTKLSFSDLYTKVDSEALGEATGYATAVEEEVETDEDITF